MVFVPKFYMFPSGVIPWPYRAGVLPTDAAGAHEGVTVQHEVLAESCVPEAALATEALHHGHVHFLQDALETSGLEGVLAPARHEAPANRRHSLSNKASFTPVNLITLFLIY